MPPLDRYEDSALPAQAVPGVEWHSVAVEEQPGVEMLQGTEGGWVRGLPGCSVKVLGPDCASDHTRPSRAQALSCG